MGGIGAVLKELDRVDFSKKWFTVVCPLLSASLTLSRARRPFVCIVLIDRWTGLGGMGLRKHMLVPWTE